MTEDELLHNVLDLCRYLHLRTAHFRPAQTARGWRTPVQGDGQGYPDLVIPGRHRTGARVLWRELKGPRGVLSVHQRAWIDDLGEANADVRVWTVKDWTSGLIRSELEYAAGRGRAA